MCQSVQPIYKFCHCHGAPYRQFCPQKQQQQEQEQQEQRQQQQSSKCDIQLATPTYIELSCYCDKHSSQSFKSVRKSRREGARVAREHQKILNRELYVPGDLPRQRQHATWSITEQNKGQVKLQKPRQGPPSSSRRSKPGPSLAGGLLGRSYSSPPVMSGAKKTPLSFDGEEEEGKEGKKGKEAATEGQAKQKSKGKERIDSTRPLPQDTTDPPPAPPPSPPSSNPKTNGIDQQTTTPSKLQRLPGLLSSLAVKRGDDDVLTVIVERVRGKMKRK